MNRSVVEVVEKGTVMLEVDLATDKVRSIKLRLLNTLKEHN